MHDTYLDHPYNSMLHPKYRIRSRMRMLNLLQHYWQKEYSYIHPLSMRTAVLLKLLQYSSQLSILFLLSNWNHISLSVHIIALLFCTVTYYAVMTATFSTITMTTYSWTNTTTTATKYLSYRQCIVHSNCKPRHKSFEEFCITTQFLLKQRSSLSPGTW